jgi:L-arabinonolactonase
MGGPTLLTTIPVKNTLGECILWDEITGSVWWTDIHAAVLYRYALGSSKLTKYDVPERLCSFGFVEDDPHLICAFASGIALYEPASRDLRWLYRPEQGLRGTRFNDGRVDRQGRFWAGTSLYWISGTAHGRALGGIEISNGLAFSPDAATLYFADSPTRQIRAYEFDAARGQIGEGRLLTEVANGGEPDGSTVDADGFIWNASWGASRVVRYAPDGAVDAEFDVPVSQPTCLCFGGDRLDLLFVSTARENLTPERLGAEPLAGDVLVYGTGYRGLPECRYRLSG